MSDDATRSLTDDQIKADYRNDPGYLPSVLKEFADLEDRMAKAGGVDEIMVPVASLNRMRMGMRAIVKSQTELGFLGFGDNDHGDRGANCDYNPFIRINTGDF
jgi:hypothetical protein